MRKRSKEETIFMRSEITFILWVSSDPVLLEQSLGAQHIFWKAIFIQSQTLNRRRQ